MGSQEWGPIRIGLVSLYEEEETSDPSLCLSPCTKGEAMWRNRGEAAIYKHGRETTSETNPDDVLILDLWPLEL